MMVSYLFYQNMKEVEQVAFSTWAMMVGTIATDRGVTILQSSFCQKLLRLIILVDFVGFNHGRKNYLEQKFQLKSVAGLDHEILIHDLAQFGH